MLKLEQVTAGYGRVNVIHEVSLELETGEVLAVLGHNGAGKTTLLRAITGLLPVASGTVTFNDVDITGLRPSARVRRGLAYVPQGQQSFPQLSTRENLQVVADAAGGRGGRGGANARGGRLTEVLDLFPALTGLMERPAGLLSGGQRQQLAMARALITGPELLILDEPTEGIQPSVVAEIEAIITRLAREGLTVVLVEQQVGYALRTADRFVALGAGRIIAAGQGGASAAPQVSEALSL